MCEVYSKQQFAPDAYLRYFVRLASSMTVSMPLPQALAMREHVTFRFVSTCARAIRHRSPFGPMPAPVGRNTSRALIAMSDACPRAWDRGWWSMMEALGRVQRFPFSP